MTGVTASVVIVSRGRPDELKRCLLGVSQVQYDGFEVVVVADPAGIKVAQSMPFAAHLKLVPFDEPNISAARNHGIAQAAGEVVAFIDDDAVPEPQWLRYLLAPAERSDVAAMGGFVRGRNGISFQWKARSLDPFGMAHDLTLEGDQAILLHPPKGRAIKTEGTNMAVRRNVLVKLGGFDPAYHYYLDETDLNMRLARAGYATALVPLAEVHHGFAPNRMRNANRVPTDLYDIGASWGVFQRKFIPRSEQVRHWDDVRHAESQRLLKHLVSGGLEPRTVRHLLRRLDEGYREGQSRELTKTRLAQHPAAPFLPFPSIARKSVLLRSRPIDLAKDNRRAADRVKRDEIVTLMCFSLNARFHRVFFNESGVWVQRGGVYGRSDRFQKLFRMTTRTRRIEKERNRVARQRGFSKD